MAEFGPRVARRRSFLGLTMGFFRLLCSCVFIGFACTSCAQKQAEAPGFPASPGQQSQPPQAQPYPSSAQAYRDAEQPGQYPTLDSLEDAERAYASAEQELLALYAPGSIAQDVGGASAEGKPHKPAAPAQTKAGADADQPNRCAQVCRALGSLERARDAICRLTSATDARCERANISVEKNRERAARCACPKPPEPAADPDHASEP